MRCINMTEKTRKLRFIDENRTKGLQKDWQGYGKSQALFGIVVLMIFLLAFVYVDNLILQYIRYEMTPTSVGGEQHS